MTLSRRGAIVGFGGVAEHGHLPGWLRADGFEIVAVVDPAATRRAAAERALPAVQAFSSLDELGDAVAIDFVDIASPPAHHAQAIETAAARGADVLCEKPLTTSVATAQSAIAAVDASAGVLHPVHNWKHSEAFRTVEQHLAESIGAAHTIRIEVERDGWSVGAGDWRGDLVLGGGGILVDHGWHAFYLAVAWAAADPVAVRATTQRRRYDTAAVEDTASCVVDFGACQAHIELTWAGRRRRTSWAIDGDGGSLRIDDDTIVVHRHGEEPVAASLVESLSEGSYHPQWFPGVIASFREALEVPAAAAAARREALWCSAILDAAYASASSDGERVALTTPRP